MMNEKPVPEHHPRRWIFVFAAIFVISLLMLFFYFTWPYRQIGPEQPIPFSHRVHAGTKQIDCRFCHPFVDQGPRAGLPEMSKCFYCHEYIIALHPEILKEKRSLVTGQPIEWERVFYVPDFVQFYHQPHISWAQLDCSECHGQVQAQDRLVRVRFQMGFCIDCHKSMGAQVDCWLACHH